ncbi:MULTISPECIES: CHAP domain-containing protein [Methylobacter]
MFRLVPVLLLLFLILAFMGFFQSVNSTPALFGNWHGSVYDPGFGSYTAQMSLHGMNGTVEYPSVGCGGTVTLLNNSGNEYRYAQHITYGNIASGGICIPDAFVTATVVDDSMDFEGSGQFQGRTYTAKGVLTLQPENLANTSEGWPNLTKPLDVTNSTQQFNTANSTPKALPHAASATFYGPAPYLSSRDSPFFGTKFSYFYLEDFEDGLLNTPGVTASFGWSVISGNNDVDSVDADDGIIDGKGNTGKSFFSDFVTNRLTFTFNAAALGGNLPTHAGIVWTDANASASRRQVEFSALDSSGTSLGSIGPFELGDDVINGTTAEDRFLGVYNPSGISSITISMPGSNNWEVDHLQYGNVIENQTPPLIIKHPDENLTGTKITTLNMVSPAVVSGYSCPRLFVLSGEGFGHDLQVFVDCQGCKKDPLDPKQIEFQDPRSVKITINTGFDPDRWTVKVRNGHDGQFSNSIVFDVRAPVSGELGSVIGEFSGVEARSNGACTAQSRDIGKNKCDSNYKCDAYYQCVEYVKRYYLTYFPEIKEIQDWGDYALTFWGRRSELQDFDYFPSGQSSCQIPQPGDIIFFETNHPGIGHVAIVTNSSEEEIGIIQQNMYQYSAEATISVHKDPVSGACKIGPEMKPMKRPTVGDAEQKDKSFPVVGWLSPKKVSGKSADKPSENIDLPPLVTPQGEIDTVGKKITPAAKSEAKEARPAECNKGSSVLSPSIGGAQGAITKYGVGTNGCTK